MAWGREGDGFQYRVLPENSTTWESEVTQSYDYDNDVRYLRLIPDPGSNQIAFIGRADGDHNEVGIWNGFAWYNIRRLDWMGNPAASLNFMDGAWLGTSGKFVFVYYDYTTTDVMNWITYDTSYLWNENWEVKTDHSVVGATTTASVDLETDLVNNRVIALFSDISQNLWLQSYDGTSWSNMNGSDPIETNLSSTSTMPFDLRIKGQRHLVVASHNQGQVSDVFSGNTSVTQAEMYRFKLIPAVGSHSVTELELTLNNAEDLISTDITNAKLYVDTNGNGTIDVGETTQIGGTGTPIINVGAQNGRIIFADDFTLSANIQLILKMDVANLDGTELMTIQMQPGKVSTADPKFATGVANQALHRRGAYTLDSVGDAHLYYGSFPDLSDSLKVRHFDYSATTWSPNVIVKEGVAPARWIVAKKSPTDTHEEIIACVSLKHEDLILEVFRFDGTTWHRDWADTDYSDSYADARGFSLSYENPQDMLSSLGQKVNNWFTGPGMALPGQPKPMFFLVNQMGAIYDLWSQQLTPVQTRSLLPTMTMLETYFQ